MLLTKQRIVLCLNLIFLVFGLRLLSGIAHPYPNPEMQSRAVRAGRRGIPPEPAGSPGDVAARFTRSPNQDGQSNHAQLHAYSEISGVPDRGALYVETRTY